MIDADPMHLEGMQSDCSEGVLSGNGETGKGKTNIRRMDSWRMSSMVSDEV